MAEFSCIDCGYEGHFSEFKTGSHQGHSDDGSEEIDIDEVECPRCESDSVYEL